MRGTSEQLTFSWEALPAKASASQGSAEALKTHAETSRFALREWLQRYALAGSSGRTSPVSCPATADGTLAPSSGRWSNAGMASPGECWTLSTSECPSDAVESSLSDVLEAAPIVPHRYFLSRKACQGIIRRAEARGKKLPEALIEALELVG